MLQLKPEVNFHFKCPFLHLSETAFSLSSTKRYIEPDVRGPFGQYSINKFMAFAILDFVMYFIQLAIRINITLVTLQPQI
jgi:hypothetical protein